MRLRCARVLSQLGPTNGGRMWPRHRAVEKARALMANNQLWLVRNRVDTGILNALVRPKGAEGPLALLVVTQDGNVKAIAGPTE